jgi:hypothetical protein
MIISMKQYLDNKNPKLKIDNLIGKISTTADHDPLRKIKDHMDKVNNIIQSLREFKDAQEQDKRE